MLGLIRALLMVFGMNQALALWVSSIAIVLGALGLIWSYIYRTSHAGDQEEKLETAMYAALEENQVRADGSDLSSRIKGDPGTPAHSLRSPDSEG